MNSRQSFRLISHTLSLLALCCALPAAADSKTNTTQSPTDPTPDSTLAELIRFYSTERQGLANFYQLPWSQIRIERLEKLHREWQKRLPKVDFEELDQQARIDYILLRNHLQSELSELSYDSRQLAEMEELLPFRKALQELERKRWRMEHGTSQASATILAGFPDQIKAIRQRVEKGQKKKEKKEEPPAESETETKSAKATNEVVALKVSPLLAKRSASAASALRDTLKTWFSFYDGYQPDFSWWVKKPYEEASKALEEYAKFLREEIAGLKGKDEDPLLGEPIGAELLQQQISLQMIPYSAEELIQIGKQEFAWCEAKMKETAEAMGAKNWKAALSKVKRRFVPPGQQDELVATQAREAIRFLKEHDLVTIPPLCEETWRLTMISPETQKTMPYAAYGGQNMMVAYAKEEMKHEDKLMSMRGNNRHFTRIVTAHELIPGHHLQGFVAARNRQYRSLFSTPFLVEGWALYWEMRLWDLDYAQTPEDKIGMLFWRMHRSARIIVSLKFHLGEMKPPEMVDFLVKRVGHERLGATAEVRRFIAGSYSPLYQCAYMIGGLQLYALHREVVRGGKMKERQFHDTVLRYNAIPIELIRAGLRDIPLSPDTKPSWKFASKELLNASEEAARN